MQTRVKTEDDIKFLLAKAVGEIKDRKGLSYMKLGQETGIEPGYINKMLLHQVGSINKLMNLAQKVGLEISLTIKEP